MQNETLHRSLLGLTLEELTALAEGAAQSRYRGRQLYQAIYGHRIGELSLISTLPQAFHRELADLGYCVGLPEVDKRFVSVDGTVRYLVEFADGQSVEAVWMPDGDNGEMGDGSDAGRPGRPLSSQKWARATVCVSSQVGCAVGCEFCLTALLGVKRNLSAGEIVGQVIAVLKDQNVVMRQDRINLVFMGMGEPFLNYDNFIQAVRLLVAGVGIPESRMTVSTAGIVPRIYDLGAEAVRPKLAISLNASNDALRTSIMPINKKWNLEKLLTAARAFPLRKREVVTFEYVLLDEVNDAPQNAREVIELLQGIRAKVNVIALNPGPGIDFHTPAEERVFIFQRILIDAGIPTFIRKPRGRDIFAACGQLKRTLELSA